MLKDAHSQLQTSSRALAEQKLQLESDLSKTEASRGEVAGMLARLQDSHKELAAEHEQLSSQHQKLTAAHVKLEAEAASVTAVRDQLQSLADDQGVQIAQLESEASRTLLELSTLQVADVPLKSHEWPAPCSPALPGVVVHVNALDVIMMCMHPRMQYDASHDVKDCIGKACHNNSNGNSQFTLQTFRTLMQIKLTGHWSRSY